MSIHQPAGAAPAGRYTQLRLTGLRGRVTPADIEHSVQVLYDDVDAILAGDPGNEELAFIALDRDQLGYLTVGHIAAVLTWMEIHHLDTGDRHKTRCIACRRVLTDDASRRRGLGPVCWLKRTGGAT